MASQPKVCWVWAKCLTLGEQQYFVWDTASLSTKWRGILKIWGALPPRGYAYDGRDIQQQSRDEITNVHCRTRFSTRTRAAVEKGASLLSAGTRLRRAETCCIT